MTHNKKKYNSGEMPFKVYSSSVEAGYEITNLHEDTYGGIKDAPMQGPFTYQYVGGNQHRHIPLNKGSDNILTRPELFHINLDSSGEIRVIGSNGDPVVLAEDKIPIDDGNSIAVDPVGKKVFYIDQSPNTINSCNFDGSDKTVLFTYSAESTNLAFDSATGDLYFTDAATGDTIKRIASDGSDAGSATTVATSKSDFCRIVQGLVIYDGDIYWSELASGAIGGKAINKASLSSIPFAVGDMTQVYVGDASQITIDETTENLYFHDYVADEIRRGSLESLPFTSETICDDGGGKGISFDPVTRKIYWADESDDVVRFFNVDDIGSSAFTVQVLKVFSSGYKPSSTAAASPYLFFANQKSGDKNLNRIPALPYFPPANYTRDPVAKRPVNIANHQTYNPIGNYTHDYEIVQTTGRTSNNRAFVEANGSGFIGDPAMPYSGSLITQFVSGARDILDTTALPNFDLSGSNKFVFVNRFNAPGGTHVSSRGDLDTYAEEFAPNNAMPWRNNTVRSQLRSRLTAYTPPPGEIPTANDPFNDPTVATRYHRDYRNPKVRPIVPNISASQEMLVTGSLYGGGGWNPSPQAIDIAAGKIYWTTRNTGSNSPPVPAEIRRANLLDGSNVETICELKTAGTSLFLCDSIALDIPNNKIYVANGYWGSPAGILTCSMEPGSELFYHMGPGLNPHPRYVRLDVPANKVYWSDIYSETITRADLSDGGNRESIVDIDYYGADMAAFELDTQNGWIYVSALSLPGPHGTVNQILRFPMTGPPVGVSTASGSQLSQLVTERDSDSVMFGMQLDVRANKIYWLESEINTPGTLPRSIWRCDMGGTNVELLFSGSADTGLYSMNWPQFVLDTIGRKLYWAPESGSVTGAPIVQANLPDKVVFDNAFVTHEIPQADLDYRWIHDSALTTYLQLPGHQNSGSKPYAPYSDIDYVLSGSHGRGDFMAISGTMIDKSQIDIQVSETPSNTVGTNNLSSSATTFVNAYSGPYQWASWQQVRMLYNPMVRKLVKDSLLSTTQGALNEGGLFGALRARALDRRWGKGIVNYKSSVVSNVSKPLKHGLTVTPSLSSGNTVNTKQTYTYINDMLTIGWDAYEISETRQWIFPEIGDASSMYRNIADLYLAANNTTVEAMPTNPVKNFIELKYSEILYPSLLNGFLNYSRARTEYAEVAGTGSNGYDRTFGHQRTFYKDDEIRTVLVARNSQGYTGSVDPTKLSLAVLNTSFDSALNTELWTADETSGIVSADGTPAGGSCFKFGGTGPATSVATRYLEFKQTLTGTDCQIAFSAMRGQHAFEPYLELPDTADENLLIQYKTPTGSWTTLTTVKTGDVNNTTFQFAFTGTIADLPTTAPDQPTSLRIAMTTFSGYEYDHYAIKDLFISYTSSEGGIFGDTLNFNPMATDGIRSFMGSSSYRNYDGELMGDTDGTMFGAFPVPSLAYTELTEILGTTISGTGPDQTHEEIDVYSSYTERLTEQMANKTPWYDSYEKYGADVRPATADMSILPEFKISDFIDFYIREEANALAPNNKFLSLPGAAVTASARTSTSDFSNEFMNKYVVAPESQKGYSILTEHAEVADLNTITITCDGMKKLLPYNGFYPANRTIQLGNLLSQSMSDHIEGSADGDDKSYPAQALQALLKPTVSPGILYNSLKAGIAVDYPIYVNTVPGTVESDGSPSEFRLASAPNFRLPFESLLNFKNSLPEGDDKPIRLVSSFVTTDDNLNTSNLFKYKFTWDGLKSPLFELAMHNFLAETVDFFLEDGKLTAFKSAPQPADGWELIGDKTYYMDIVLKDTVEMNKFITYSGSEDIQESLCFVGNDTQDGDRFGNGGPKQEGIDMVSGSDAYYCLVGAPDHQSDDGAAYFFRYAPGEGPNFVGWQQLMKFVPPSDFTNGEFGRCVSLASGSGGFYSLMGAPFTAPSWTGQAYLYHHTQTTTIAETILTASSAQADDWFGMAVSVVSGANAVHALVGAPARNLQSPYGNQGATFLFTSSSLPGETFYVTPSSEGGNDNQKWQTFITASDAHSPQAANYEPRFGSSVRLISGSAKYDIVTEGAASLITYDTGSGLYAIIGMPRSGSVGVGHGAAYAYRNMRSSSIDGPFVIPATLTANRNTTFQTYITASDGADGDYFGDSVDMISSSDGLRYLIGAYQDDDGASNAGSAYLYHSSSTEAFHVDVAGAINQKWQTKITASDPTTDADFGQSVAIVSGSDQYLMLVGAPGFGPQNTGSAYLFHSRSGETFGVKPGGGIFQEHQYKIIPSMDTTNQYFGGCVTMVSSAAPSLYGTGTILCTIGAEGGQIDPLSGSGVACSVAGGTGSLASTVTHLDVQQDYKQHGKLFGLALEKAYDPAYCAYTPPCFYGDATARLSFTPVLDGKYGLETILNEMKVENILNLDKNRVATLIDVPLDTLTPLQEQNKMPVSSSIDYYGTTTIPFTTFNADGTPATVTNDAAPPAWVISTRFECPVIDVSSSQYQALYTSAVTQITAAYSFSSSAQISEYPRAPWLSYGKVPKNEKGMYFSIQQSFPEEVNNDSDTTGSLLDELGFTPPGPTKIGQVRQEKRISEAIVAIPYFDRPVEEEQWEKTLSDTPSPDMLTTEIDQFHFIKVNNLSVRGAKKAYVDAGTESAGAEALMSANTTISKMVLNMYKYVFPPHLDFVKYAMDDPFAIYIFPFESTLKQGELTDIWQGITPDSALTMVKDQVSIRHNLDDKNFFGNIKNRSVLGEMKLLIFKVKRRSKFNYYKITENAQDDERFQFVFADDGTEQSTLFEKGTYNWPYDFFSLVEKAKIEVSFGLKPLPVESPVEVAAPTAGNLPLGIEPITSGRFDLG